MRKSVCLLCLASALIAVLAFPAASFGMTAALEVTLHPSYWSNWSYFGNCVDIEGQTAVVGDSIDPHVALFSSSSGVWTETASYSSSGQPRNVSLSGDDLAIAANGGWSSIASRASGAWNIESAPTIEGAADVDGDLAVTSSYAQLTAYRRVGDTWLPIAFLPWSASGASEGVQLSGTTFTAIDADEANVGIFDVIGDAIVQVGTVPVSVPFPSISVALSGSTLVVGAGEQVEVYERSPEGSWLYHGNLTPSSPLLPDPVAFESDYGVGLAIDGDRIAVGAPFDVANDGGKRGSVFIFARNGGAWSESLKIPAETVPYDDGWGPRGPDFGYALALDGDQLMVGARRETMVGAAYIYRLDSSPDRQPTPQSLTIEHGVRLDFDDLVTPDTMRADVVAEPAHHPAPSGFEEVDGSYYDLLVSSSYLGGVTVSIPYDPSATTAAESGLRLYHWRTDHWEDITTGVDTTNHLVMGRTDSFSPFAVFAPSSGAGGGETPVTSTPASSPWSLALGALLAFALGVRSLSTRRTASE